MSLLCLKCFYEVPRGYRKRVLVIDLLCEASSTKLDQETEVYMSVRSVRGLDSGLENGKRSTKPAAPVAQLVTSKPSDTLGREFESRELRFFLAKKIKIKIDMPNIWTTIKSLVHKIRLHGRRGKGTAESLSREKLRHAPQKEGGWEILCDLPPVWPRLERPTSLTSRINGNKTHTHHTYKSLSPIAEKIWSAATTRLSADF